MPESMVLRRADLLRALERVRLVIPNRCPRPIWQAVHLVCSEGRLILTTTDGAMLLSVAVPVDGEIPPCVVPCDTFLKRLKSSSQPECELLYRENLLRLFIRCGTVRHELPTLPICDFPVIPAAVVESGSAIPTSTLATALAVTLHGAANTASRYALDAVLLESDASGTRLAATDGRRLVTAELGVQLAGFPAQTLLPQRFARLLVRLLKQTRAEHVSLAALPVDSETATNPVWPLTLAGPDWRIWVRPDEGNFPNYRGVTPASASKFAIDREALLQAVRQVAGAGDTHNVQIDLSPRRIRLSGGDVESGISQAAIPARFVGGGDDRIQTAFRAEFLIDALNTLPLPTAILDIGQNTLVGHSVSSRPALLYPESDPRICWVIMPVCRGLSPSRASLGSNYVEPEGEQSSDADQAAESRPVADHALAAVA